MGYKLVVWECGAYEHIQSRTLLWLYLVQMHFTLHRFRRVLNLLVTLVGAHSRSGWRRSPTAGTNNAWTYDDSTGYITTKAPYPAAPCDKSNCCLTPDPCTAPCELPSGWGAKFLLVFCVATTLYLLGGAVSTIAVYLRDRHVPFFPSLRKNGLVLVASDRLYVQGYAVKVQGKDHRTDGLTTLVPHWEHWLNVAGLCRDGITFSVAYAQAKMHGADYSPVPPVSSKASAEQPAARKPVDPDSPLRNPGDEEKPLFGAETADDQPQNAESGSDEELVE